MTIVDFAISVVIIVAASELFTNAVEWAGYRMRLGSGATGSLLAALGTSLPEFTVPIVALVSHAQNSDAVAMGAALGSPMLLLGIGMGMSAIALLSRRSNQAFQVGVQHARRDLATFFVAFITLVILAIWAPPRGVRIAWSVALLLAYVWYVRKVLKSGEPEDSMPEPLHFLRWDAERVAGPIAISLQLLISAILLIVASDLFVGAINGAATFLKLDTLTVAAILTPIATELPETMNSILWIRTGDDTLAFGNIAGSAVFQACLLGGLGLTFTSWNVGRDGIYSMVATLITAAFLLGLFWKDGKAKGKWLILAAIPWLVYVAVTLQFHH